MDTSISLMGLICRQRREDTLLHVNIGPPWLGNSYWRLDKNLSKLKRRNGNYCKQVKSWYAFCHFHARLNKLKTSVFSKGSLFSSKIQNNLFKLQYEESFQHKRKAEILIQFVLYVCFYRNKSYICSRLVLQLLKGPTHPHPPV